jgi:hypothetical protein
MSCMGASMGGPVSVLRAARSSLWAAVGGGGWLVAVCQISCEVSTWRKRGEEMRPEMAAREEWRRRLDTDMGGTGRGGAGGVGGGASQWWRLEWLVVGRGGVSLPLQRQCACGPTRAPGDRKQTHTHRLARGSWARQGVDPVARPLPIPDSVLTTTGTVQRSASAGRGTKNPTCRWVYADVSHSRCGPA